MTRIFLLTLALITPARATDLTYYTQGHTMANGARFNPHALTCATNAYPLGTQLRITHQGRSVVLPVTDRTARKTHAVDVTEAAFRRLADRRIGRLHGVRVEEVAQAPRDVPVVRTGLVGGVP